MTTLTQNRILQLTSQSPKSLDDARAILDQIASAATSAEIKPEASATGTVVSENTLPRAAFNEMTPRAQMDFVRGGGRLID